MVTLLKLKPWQAFLFAGAATYISVLVRLWLILHLNIPFQDEVTAVVDIWDGLGGLITIVWLYTLGTQLNLRLPEVQQGSLMFFKTCFAGLILVLIAMVWLEWEGHPDKNMQIVILLFGLVFHLYIYWIISKLLLKAESNVQDGIGGTIVSFIFLPIGIWWLQKRINTVFADRFEEIDRNTPLDHQLDQSHG